jgi:acetolactate synthase-1/2/3 large subunit
MKLSGGEVIAKMLKKEGVEKVFGIIDGTYFGLYANFEKYGIELITPRHESSAAHMAGAYARLTGKLGVCIASNGPGVANILPGVAVENAEGNRVMLITSSRRQDIIYPDRGGAYQYFDQVGVISAMAKYSAPVRNENRIIEIMHQAFRNSYKGRPGVVHVDVPENIMNGKIPFDESCLTEPNQYRRTSELAPADELVKQAASMIINAEFPIIHAGSGIIHARAYEELEDVAKIAYMPVTTSWGARGALAEDNELAVSMVHVDINDKIRNEADLVLILGSRMGETDWWGKAPNWNKNQKVIQVDIEEEFIGRNKAINLGIQSDVKVFLKKLSDELKIQKDNIRTQRRQETYGHFLDKMHANREKLDSKLEDMASPMITAHIGNACNKIFGEDAVAIFDGGNTAVWGQFYYQALTPGHGLSTPKMGMLGAGVGQTLGAKAALPQKHVYCIIGDGAMGFHMQEIETAVRNDLAVTFIVVCDKQWGMVKMTQQFALRPVKTIIKKSLDEDETINADFHEIEFDKLARSMGAQGFRTDNPKELESILTQCKVANKCSVVHVDVDPVKHMWAPALQAFKKMHAEPKG